MLLKVLMMKLIDKILCSGSLIFNDCFNITSYKDNIRTDSTPKITIPTNINVSISLNNTNVFLKLILDISLCRI